MSDKIWLHLGLGSFHRAHQAYAFERLLQQGLTGWRFEAGNIRDDAERTVQGLLRQGMRYTLETVSPEGQRTFHEIKSISRVYPYEPGLTPLIAAGADPSTKVISFTVTEAGYCLKSDLSLDRDNPVIAAALKGALNCIYSVCAAILKQRLNTHAGAVTLLCCDNVRENGRKFARGLREFLTLRGESEVLNCLNTEVSCPNTMVDRITPRPAVELPAEILKETGREDAVPVMAEEFFQWVIEDNFKAGRPPLEQAGAELVDDVTPYEDAKLRILNASHTCLALLGVIKGYNYVFECARDPELCALAHGYITDCVLPCLKGNGLNLEAYRDEVLHRFKNTYIRDTLQRICQDSLSKLASFIRPTIEDCYRLGVPARGVVLIPALYLHFMHLLQEKRVPFAYQDSDYTETWAEKILASADEAAALAGESTLFGSAAGNPSFIEDLKERSAFVKAFAKQHELIG